MNNQLQPAFEDRDILRDVANDLAHEVHNRDRKRSASLDPDSYAFHFVSIIDFVNGALEDETIHVLKAIGRHHLLQYDLTRFAKKHLQFISRYVEVIKHLPPENDYVEQINLFRSCCTSIGILDDFNCLGEFWCAFKKFGPASPLAQEYARTFNELVDRIRTEARETKFSSVVAETRRQAKIIYIEYCGYAGSLFDSCAQLVVIRIDLSYKKQCTHSVDVKQAKKDIKHFFNNRRSNKIFNHLLGRMVKLEYGVDKGFHHHLLLFFDGSKRDHRKHVNLAKTLGEYWVNVITKGRGDYWNSNDKIADFIKLGICGIGSINAADTDLRKNLNERVIRYLCKSDQFVRPKLSKKVKLITRGNPRPPAKKRRPRKGNVVNT